MGVKDLFVSAKDLPFSLHQKIWNLEINSNSLKDNRLLDNEDSVFKEIPSKYGEIDKNKKKEIRTFKLQ